VGAAASRALQLVDALRRKADGDVPHLRDLEKLLLVFHYMSMRIAAKVRHPLGDGRVAGRSSSRACALDARDD
jgi:hypothetical protein